MHTINTPPHTYTQVTLLHTHICLACRANSPLTVERTLELFCRVFLDAVFDDLAKNVCMAISLSAHMLANSIITIALATCTSATWMPSAHQMEAVLLEISTSTCLPRCTQTTAHQSFLCLWYRATGPHKEVLKNIFQFVSVCLQSSWIPALRAFSCLSAMFFF